MKNRLLIAFALMLISVLTLCSCVVIDIPDDFSSISGFIAGDDKYDAFVPVKEETIDSAVTSLEISWGANNVTFKTSSDDSVKIVQLASPEFDTSNCFNYELDDTELTIRDGRGTGFFKNWSSLKSSLRATNIEIYLPASPLNSLDVKSASATVCADDLSARALDLDIASGSVDITGAIENIDADVASGNVELTVIGDCGSVSLDVASGSVTLSVSGICSVLDAEEASGSISVSADSINSIDFSCASGKFSCVANKADVVDADITSGSAELSFAAAPASIKAETTSGSIVFTLPADTGFTAKFDGASSGFKSDFAVKKEADMYICGDGANSYWFKAASGIVKLKIAD